MARVALVTGASGGIGAEVVKRFVDSGITVAAVDIKRSELSLDLPGSVHPFITDISVKENVDRLVSETRERLGCIDILVNSAGVIDRTPFFELTEKQWDKVLDINLKGTFLVSQAVLKCMIEQGRGGRIINLASISGEVGGITAAASYSASKAGVISLTKTLAKIGGPFNVTANAVSPGPVKTAMISDWSPEEVEYFINHTPLRRLGEPADVADTICYLASDESSFISGQVIRVNGGFYV